MKRVSLLDRIKRHVSYVDHTRGWRYVSFVPYRPDYVLVVGKIRFDWTWKR